jgi:hypothetical protein
MTVRAPVRSVRTLAHVVSERWMTTSCCSPSSMSGWLSPQATASRPGSSSWRRSRSLIGSSACTWSNSVPPRPSTWDLFISTIALLDARIERVIITDVREERHYFAQMVVHRAEEATPLLLTARPSDAIALALRAFGARVFAQAHVLDEAGLLGDGSHWVRPAPEPAEETVATDDPDAGDGEPDLQEAYEGLIALAGTVGKPVDPEAARLNRDRAAAERAAAARSARSFGDRGPRDDGTPRPDGLD